MRLYLARKTVRMKKFLILYGFAVTLLLIGIWRRYGSENRRLLHNQRALMSQVGQYRTRADEAAASVEVLQLRCREFERLRAEDAQRIRQLGIRLRRVEAAAVSATQSAVEFRAPLRDTLIRHLSYAPVCDTSRVGASLAAWPVRTFRWRDTWVSVEGRIVNDSVVCRVESVDTLRQVIHRVPRRFLFFRFGTKAVRQEIVSSNPHTRIVYAEYVRFDH